MSMTFAKQLILILVYNFSLKRDLNLIARTQL